ncbi:hypothetical protein PHLCEN_2v1085 [Hermanssonia centrifuga]|uniref:Uncharacterized protein n=1 Tax=Hermanssonia centrifuga TaxID=98765 RepID=A0A2R6S446_9APHY|nr:hypothetical protein PHLCEN_2v1085 [Hermanssonia centrifuga]
MLSLGALIWVSVRPLLRLVLCTGFGVLITRADIFPAVASRGAGQIILVRKVVSALNQYLPKKPGPLFLVAFIYEGMGLLLAWIVKQFFWVPHRFRYGILVAGGWGNYGDIRTPPSYLYSDLADDQSPYQMGSNLGRYEYYRWPPV